MFYTCFLNELRKLKGTFASWLILVGAFFIPVLYLIYYLTKSTGKITPEGLNPWDKFFGLHFMAAGPLLVPLFIVLLTSLILQIEHKADGLKKIFSLPVPRWCFFGAKILIVLLLILVTYIFFLLFVLGTGFLLGYCKPGLDLHLFQPNYMLYLKALFRSFVAVLGILGIQFWLSIKIKNFMIPLGVGIVMIVAALTVHRAEEAIFFPYTYNLLNIFNADPVNMKWFTKASFLSLVVFSVTLIGSYIHASKTNIK